VKKKEGLPGLIEMMLPPEARQEAKKRKSHARRFFYNTLLPKIGEETIKTTEDVYDTLAEYRRLHNTDVSIDHIFFPAYLSMAGVIAQHQAGKPYPDFFEIDLAFSLVRDAIIKDDRFFSEPTHGIKPGSRMFQEACISVVEKYSRKIELEKANLKIHPV